MIRLTRMSSPTRIVLLESQRWRELKARTRPTIPYHDVSKQGCLRWPRFPKKQTTIGDHRAKLMSPQIGRQQTESQRNKSLQPRHARMQLRALVEDDPVALIN